MVLQKNEPIPQGDNTLKDFIICKLYEFEKDIKSISFIVSNSFMNKDKSEEHNVKFNKMGNVIEFLNHYNKDCKLLVEDTVIGLGGKEYSKMHALSTIVKFVIKTNKNIIAYQLEPDWIGSPTCKWEDISHEYFLNIFK